MKRFLIVCLLLAITHAVNAQSRFGGGLSAGFAISQVSGDNLSGFNKPGAFAGAFGYYGFNDKNWLQLELNFIQKGSYQAPKDDFPHKYLLNLNYVELPVLYKFMPVGKRFVFEIGPTFGYLVSYSERSELGDIANAQGVLQFKKYELAAIAGINYKLRKGFSVNLRAIQSVLQVRNHQGNATWYLNRGQYNTSLCLSLRYTFQPKAETTTN